MGKSLSDEWMSAPVRVAKGPFADKEGQVTAVAGGRCEVAFDGNPAQKDRVWLSVSQLEKSPSTGKAT